MGCTCSQLETLHLAEPFGRLVLVGEAVVYAQDGILQTKRVDNLPSFPACTLVNSREIYVSGGIMALENEDGLNFEGRISSSLLRLNFEAMVSERSCIEKIAELQIARYAHVSISLHDKLFLIGGRTYDEQVLRECECYDLNERRWLAIPSLNLPRASASAVIFRQKIYVFGGYNGHQRRSRKIQCLGDRGEWTVLPFKLPIGLEAMLVMPSTFGKFVVFGGSSNVGPSQAVIRIDLTNEVVEGLPNLVKARVMAKGFVRGNNVLIFGGCEDHSVEVHSLTEPRPPAIRHDLNLGSFTTPIQMRSFSQALFPLIVLEPQDKATLREDLQFEPIRGEPGCVLFGTDAEPFVSSFNFKNGRAQRRPVDIRFGLKAYQSCISLGQTILISGGINTPLNKVSRKAFIYDPRTDIVKQIGSMTSPRYGHGMVRFGTVPYAVGGKAAGDDSILGSVECLQFDKWLEVGHMRKKRASPGLFETSSGFVIFGGYAGNGIRLSQVEVFSVKSGFVEVDLKFRMALEGPFVVSHKQLFIFGGRTSDGDSEKIVKADHPIFDESGKTFEWPMAVAGKMSRGRAMPKVFHSKDRSEAYLFGIPNRSIQIFSLKFGGLVKRESLGMEGFLQTFEQILQTCQDPALKTYSMASVNSR